MACYHPITAYRPRNGGPLVFQDGLEDADEITIACGNCYGCDRRRSRDWAIRSVHETRAHKHNCFITLTYADQHLPKNKSLSHADWKKFIDKLRAAVHRDLEKTEPPAASAAQAAVSQRLETAWRRPSRPLAGSGGTGGRQNQNQRFLWDWAEVSTTQPDAPEKRPARRLHIGYYMCGEYGELNGRPHFHALLFAIDFADRKHYKTSRGNRLDTSQTLTEIWGLGHATVGGASYAAARYVSEYIIQKRRGDGENVYRNLTIDGEIIERKKEYNQMSRRPGVGSSYLRKHGKYLAHDWVIANQGRKQKPPRYYDEWFKKHDPDQWEVIQEKRRQTFLQYREHTTPERLTVQETVDRARRRNIKRDL